MKIDSRLFLCIWGEGYLGADDTARTAVHTYDFFTENVGYDIDARREITCLEPVGAVAVLNDCGLHCVVRVR